ncbi:gamma-glutamyl hydrolase A-like [Leptidea sinapis]|uniref:folate gamma-glutamyl hydrolase n=1 Tax=Leptidea sinapis TaxID=189913 RepID=A0A5E4QFN7_9NEOP|nr:gamma-glutamyl hydrolase A-like [Leptidea sinapis]VVC96336.1 unnamed protein product [Leptidea sinapis]
MIIILFASCLSIVASGSIVNNRPIIGVLSQETFSVQHLYRNVNYLSYIAASYVKDTESSGARVVPISIGKPRSYYEHILRHINGVLFPGGATYFNQSQGYADAGEYIYKIAQELNDNGDYFPIFGTCLGFELLIIIASGRGEKENRVKCHSYGNQRLNFTDDFRTSRMFKGASDDIIEILANDSVTVNAHQFCIVDENLTSHNLTQHWQTSSYGIDDQGIRFISSIEHKRYPFYGIQFHPEKIAFEWRASENYPHTWNAVRANRHFMDFFVNESRKNTHSFADEMEEQRHLIYNYAPKYSGARGGYFEQIYVFKSQRLNNYT